MIPAGWGSEAWGSGPWGGAALAGVSSLTINLVSALAISENVVRLTYSEPVSLTSLLDLLDGTIPSHYSIQPVAGTFGQDGEASRAVSVVSVFAGPLTTQVDLTLDRPLTGFPAIYTATSTGVFSVSGDPQSAGTVDLYGLYRGITATLSDLASPVRDFANPQTLSGLLDPLPNTTDPAQLGTFPIDETGDVAFDEGVASYKKRVFRRLMTQKGRYAHLPDYGVSVFLYIKKLARPGTVQFLANEAEQQIKQEPETQSVSVDIVQTGNVTYYRIIAKTKAGQTLNQLLPLTTSS